MSSKNTSDPEKAANMIHSAAIHLLRRLRKTDETSGISAARLSILSVLVFTGDKTPGELAQIEQVKPPTMTKLIQGLETDGLVIRRVHAGDKRASRIRVTAKGRRKLIKAQKLRIQTLSELMQSLDPEEIQTLTDASLLMEKLSASRD